MVERADLGGRGAAGDADVEAAARAARTVADLELVLVAQVLRDVEIEADVVLGAVESSRIGFVGESRFDPAAVAGAVVVLFDFVVGQIVEVLGLVFEVRRIGVLGGLRRFDRAGGLDVGAVAGCECGRRRQCDQCRYRRACGGEYFGLVSNPHASPLTWFC